MLRERVIFQDLNNILRGWRAQRRFKEEITINQRQTDDLTNKTIMLLNSSPFVWPCANYVEIRHKRRIVKRNPGLPGHKGDYHRVIIPRNSARKTIAYDG